MSGYKTYAVGVIMILYGIAGMILGPDLPSAGDPAQLIGTGFGLIFLRMGIAKGPTA